MGGGSHHVLGETMDPVADVPLILAQLEREFGVVLAALNGSESVSLWSVGG